MEVDQESQLQVLASTPDPDLNDLSKEELIERVRKLTLHVKQLRNVVKKKGRTLEGHEGEPICKRNRKDRPVNFSTQPKRHVALKIAYLGWDYQGLAAQEDTDHTIEAHIFGALIRTKLIESRETSSYHRCGRTDKGVSGFGQVISIDLRCRQRKGLGVIFPPDMDPASVPADAEPTEFNYCKMLNRILPDEIRVLAWSPVKTGFSARFSCLERTYKYYFPLADLDLSKMRQGAKFLVGTHDFRNFCKLDTNGENSTIRRVIETHVDLVFSDKSTGSISDDSYAMCVLIIKGQSFVWHQIRCIVAVLVLIGKGLEEPEIVARLLDINIQPKKPQYSMASFYPLVLFEVGFGNEVEWQYDSENVHFVMSDFQRIWAENAIKSCMIFDMIKTLEVDGSAETNSKPKPRREAPIQHLDSLLMGSKARVYQKLVDRPVCDRVPIPRPNPDVI